MADIEKAMTRIAAHERECTLRYQNIERRLEDGSKRFDKLENMIWAVYPFRGEGERRTVASNLNCWEVEAA